RLRRQDPEAILVDAGNAFLRDDKIGQLDFLSREEQKLYLRAMARDRYDAAAIATTELLFGSAWFQEARRDAALPYVSSNVSERGERFAPPARMARAHGLRFAFVSAFDPPRGPGASRRFEQSMASLTIGDPVESLTRAAHMVRDSADLLVAIGRLPPATIRRLV